VSYFSIALWAEALKARRSKVPWLAGLAFSIAPLAGGLFMWILKDPERARAMGIIGTKAQITVGVADWPAFFGFILQGAAGGGALIFAFVTAWVFGREFSDHTAKELLAVPAPRASIVAAKLMVILLWAIGVIALVFVVGLAVGALVVLPGWSLALVWRVVGRLAIVTLLSLVLMPAAACFASVGGGYLAPLGFTALALAFAQILYILGWGSWFPWSVPLLFSELSGTHAEQIGPHSFVIVILTGLVGLAATFAWWYMADQKR
jgi:ABC-2 type transport system permease protein